jgi:hypothetical protein
MTERFLVLFFKKEPLARAAGRTEESKRFFLKKEAKTFLDPDNE